MARDYAHRVVKSVEHLASVHCVFNENLEEAMQMKDVYKTTPTHITCSDRAAANHAAIRISAPGFILLVQTIRWDGSVHNF